MMKIRFHLLTCLLICLSPFWVYSQSGDDSTAVKKPDLIIDTVSYKRYVPEVHPGQDNQLAMGDHDLEFTLRVKNVGTAPFVSGFEVLNTRSNLDIDLDRYTHGQAAVIAGGKPMIINPYQSVEIKVEDSFMESPSRVKFLIATDGQPHKKRKFQKVDELNYANNTYMLELRQK